MNRYLISGVAPGKGGVGALVKSLDDRKYPFNYNPLYVRNPKVSATGSSAEVIASLLKNGKIAKFIYESVLFLCSLIYVQLRILTMYGNTVILIYPQYFNSFVLTKLVKNNDVALYVMDNSFFCIKSNNYLEGQECMKCIDGISNIDKSCSPLSKISSTRSAIDKIEKLKSISPHMHFLAQNYQQFILLKKTFGDRVRGSIVGMTTEESYNQTIVSKKHGYDIVFHGSNYDFKGVMYVLELAKHLKQYSFLLPISPNVKQIEYPNVHFEECTWSTGLKEFTANARLVLCPSIYSSPVEGSLLKSIAYNGNVAVYDNDFGFQNEIDSNALLRLNSDISFSCGVIDEFIKSKRDMSLSAKGWLKSYVSNLNDKNIFEWNLSGDHNNIDS